MQRAILVLSLLVTACSGSAEQKATRGYGFHMNPDPVIDGRISNVTVGPVACWSHAREGTRDQQMKSGYRLLFLNGRQLAHVSEGEYRLTNAIVQKGEQPIIVTFERYDIERREMIQIERTIESREVPSTPTTC